MTNASPLPEFDWDPGSISKDLALMDNLRWVMKAFSDRICSESVSAEPEIIEILRLAPMYDFAEFFFILSARQLVAEADIERIVELHNAYIVQLTKDKSKMHRLGLKMDRLLSAIFTADTRPRLMQTWREHPGSFDQSNLARFLAGVMSTETTRKIVVASHKAGFLNRHKTALGTMVISSTGRMEKVFGSCVRELRQMIENRAFASGGGHAP